MPDGGGPIPFDVAGARAAGYSDGEIASYVGGLATFNTDAARRAGYADDEIIDHLAVQPKAPEPAPPPSSTLGGIGKAAAQLPTDIAGGLIKAGGDVVTAGGTAIQSAARNAESFTRRQTGIINRIDAGETVPAMDDPLGYGDASPRQRSEIRQGLERDTAALPAPEDAGLGQAGQAVKTAGGAVIGAGDAITEYGVAAHPLTDEEQQRFSVQSIKLIGSLIPYVGAAVVGGLPAVVGLAGVQGFGAHYDAAKQAGVSDEDAAIAGSFGGLATAGLMTVPIGKAMEVAAALPNALKGEFLGTVWKMAESGATLTAFSQLQTVADNVVAGGTYDPVRSPTKGVGENLGPQFLAGAVIPGVGAALGAAGRLAGRALPGRPNVQARPPRPAVDDVLNAPDLDTAIDAAQQVAAGTETAPVATPGTPIDVRAETERLATGDSAGLQQAALLRLFHNTGAGAVEQTPEGGYQFRTTNAAGDEVTHPIEVWNPSSAAADDTANAIREHYGRAGVDVVFYQDDPAMPFDGTHDRSQPDTIFLSNNPARDIAQVAAHEFTHVLQTTTLPDGSSLGDLLNQQIAAGITPAGQRYAAKVFGQTAPKRAAFPEGPEGGAAHANAVRSHLISELGADIGGEAPKFQSFLPRVIDAIQQRYGDSVAADVLGKLLDGLRSAMETIRGLFGDTGTRSQHWVSNLGEIHDTLAKMYAARFGTPVEREQAALAAMRDRAERDRATSDQGAPSSTGLPEAFAGLGQGIGDNLRKTLWDKVRAGETTENGQQSNILILAKALRAAGGLRTPESFDRLTRTVGLMLDDRSEGWQKRLNEAGQNFLKTEPVQAVTPVEPGAALSRDAQTDKPVTSGGVTPGADYAAIRDATTKKTLQLRRWLDELAAERDAQAASTPQARLLTQTEAAILRPAGGDETALPDATRARLDDVRQQLDEVTHPQADTPEMAKVRDELGATAGAKAAAAAAYVTTPEGSPDLGRIDETMAAAIGSEPAPIRMTRLGEEHIAGRQAELTMHGFSTPLGFVQSVATHFGEIWSAGGGSLMLVRRVPAAGREHAHSLYVLLEHGEGGGAYEVKSGGVFRRAYPKGSGRKLLWRDERANIVSAGTDSRATPHRPQTEMSEPGTVHSAEHQSNSDMGATQDDVNSHLSAPTPVASTARPADYGANNKMFTAEMAEKARAVLREKFSRLNAGFDPELMAAGFNLAGYHIEAGSRRFTDYARAMVEDLGDGVRPYLAHFYNSVRDFPGFDAKGMDDAAHVKQVHEAAPGDAADKAATSSPPAPKTGEGDVVTHTTQKGKVLTGTIRRDLTHDHAKTLDPFTFKKDGGFFIRASKSLVPPPPSHPEPVPVLPDARAATPDHELADRIATRLDRQRMLNIAPLTARELQGFAEQAYGGTLAQGAYSRDRLYDAVELGVNRYIQNHPERFSPSVDAAQAEAAARELAALKESLPTQTVRAGEKDAYQQFSTPPDYAYAANWVANLRPDDHVLEPSAGVGGLIVHAMNAGVRETTVNELSDKRRGMIAALQPTRTAGEDAAQLHNILPANVRPTVVVMNPPFSRAAERMGGRMVLDEGAKHIEQALARLEPGGRLVAIVGEGMKPEGTASQGTRGGGTGRTFREWWQKIGAEYDVRANVGVDRDIYTKYGTSFPTRFLVIDKNAPSGRPMITGQARDAADLIERLQGVRDERGSVEPLADQSGRPEMAAGGEGDAGAVGELHSPTGVVGAGEGGRGDTQAGVTVPAGTSQPGGNGGNPGGGGPAASEPVVPVQSQSGRRRAGGQSRQRTGAGDGPLGSSAGGGADGVRPDGSGERDVPGLTPPPEAVLATENATAAPDNQAVNEAVYEAYKPQRVQIIGAKPHPGALVQSAAMATVLPPATDYKPRIPAALVKAGALSDAQLEAIVYAGHAHSDVMANGKRRGFLIGDGTGVGKGREIAGILLDNFQNGRTKAVWVSEKRALVNDARRDWNGMGRPASDILDHGKMKPGEDIKAAKGILFTSYDTLKSAEQTKTKDGKVSGKERVDQIIEWLGKDFDGVIAFDEAHNMGNSTDQKGGRGAKKAAQKALAGMRLQDELPNARVVYVSATGATEVSNLAYVDRLGLWGEGTAFPTRDDFIGQVSKGGIAGMELVARDMKALGHYITRNLSYDGVDYDRVEHVLSADQRATYDKMAEGWQLVLRHFNAALEATGATEDGKTKNSKAKSAAMSAFWGGHQRFFNQIITSMQMPSVVRGVEADLKAGRQAVLQLVNTMEAAQERGLEKARASGDGDLEDLDMTPRDQLMQMVEKSYPVQQMEEYADDKGNIRSRPAVDSEGRPVVNRQAVAARDRLLDELGSLRVPDGPLEILLNHFGPDKVAEVTGRKQRVVRKPDDSGQMKTMVEQRGSGANVADASAFQAGKKPILVFSEAGGTGRSYHAENGSGSENARRSHYLVQGGWRADKAVQGFGRTHRTNQASAPIFHLVTTDLQGQKRFISSIARRLAQLGALTKGERRAADQGMFGMRDNLESTEAKDGLIQFFKDVERGEVEGVTMNDLEKGMGLKLRDENGAPAKSPPEMAQFLNRVLSLTVDHQNRVFQAFSDRMDTAIARASAAGTLDVGVETYKADKVSKVSEQTVYTDPRSGAETKHVHLNAQNRNEPISFAETLAGRNKTNGVKPDTFIQNSRSGRVFAVTQAGNYTDADGRIIPQVRLTSPTDYQFLDRAKVDRDNWKRLTVEEARPLWDQQVAATPEFRNSALHIITGAVLPIWDRLGGNPKIFRLQTDQGERMLGRVIPATQVDATLQSLGAEGIKVTASPAEIAQQVLHGATARLANAWTIKRSLVAGEPRIELVGPDYRYGEELARSGVFSERIAYNTRYFIPTEPQAAAAAIEGITRSRPVTALEGGVQFSPRIQFSPRREEQTETPEFRRWFGASKVVDAEGRPLVVYHGTASDIEQFRAELLGISTEAKSARKGFFFTDEPEVANEYADMAPPLGRQDEIAAHTRRLNELTAQEGALFEANKELAKRARRGEISKEQQEDLWARTIRDPLEAVTGEMTHHLEALKEIRKYNQDRRFTDGGQNVIPAYLSIQNPLIHDFGNGLYRDMTFSDLLKQAVSEGRDGVIFANVNDDPAGTHFSTVYVVLDPTQIKSAIGNSGAFDPNDPRIQFSPRREEQTETPLFSALTRAVEGIKQEKATPGQWIATLKNLPGVKPEERAWTGLDDWLGKQPKSVTKAEVLDYLRANALDVREVTKGATDDSALRALEPEIRALGIRGDLRDVSPLTIMINGGSSDLQDRWAEANYKSADREPKFGKYTLPGGENYRELLITLPPKTRAWEVFSPADGHPLASFDTEAEAMADARRRGDGFDYGRSDAADNPAVYRSSHWDEPNVLAHARFSERTAPDGAKVLHVEEVQSDWHQAGRKTGYRQEQPEFFVQNLRSGNRSEIFPTQEAADAYRNGLPESMRAQTAIREQTKTTGEIPDAPFKTTWPMLVMKRMIQYAVDHGFDRVAWTPGDVQADRYSLALHIGRIDHEQVHDPDTGQPLDSYDIWAHDKTGRQVILHENEIPIARVRELVGQEMAGKIQRGEGEHTGGAYRDVRSLTGLDLKTGGEGMRGFYDRQLPSEVQKLAGKFGARVGRSEIGTGKVGVHATVPDEQAVADHGEALAEARRQLTAAREASRDGADNSTERAALAARVDALDLRMREETNARMGERTQTVHSFDVTPAMKAAVQREGLPLFSPRAESAASPRRQQVAVRDERETERWTPEQALAYSHVGRVVETPAWRERLASLTDDLGRRAIRYWLDPYIGLKADDPAGYVALRNANTSAGAARMFLTEGTLKFAGTVYELDQRNGGVEHYLIRPLRGEEGRFIWWVAAHRAERLAAEDRENRWSQADIDTIKATNQGQVPFDYTLPNGQITRSREAVYLDSLRKLDEFNKNVLELGVRSGLISEELAKTLFAHPYVPFYRVAEDGGGFAGPNLTSGFVKQNAFKTLKGGTQKLQNDLWDNAITNWSHMIDASLRNRAAAGVLDVGVTNGAVTERSARDVERMSKAEREKTTVWVMNNGRKQYFQIDDRMLFTAISALDFTGFRGPVMDAATKFKTVLTQGVTSSPLFMLRNSIRDAQQAIAVSPMSYNIVKNVVTGFRMGDLPGALNNVARAVAGQQSQRLRLSGEAADAIAGGATMHLGAGHDTGALKIGLDTMLDRPDTINAFWHRISRIGRAYKAVAGEAENAQRFALYHKLIAEGVPKDQAAFAARDLTDFTLKGAGGIARFLTQTVPFMNAWIQGLYKAGRAAADQDRDIAVAVGGKVAWAATKRVAIVLGATTLMTLALDAIYADDEDYKKRTEADRNANFWFKFGGVQFRIPMGFEIAALGRIAANGVEAFLGTNEMTGRRFADNVLQILGTQMSLNPTPQIVRPVLDLAENRNFAGSPIIGAGMDRLRPEDQYTGATTLPARWVSSAGNAAARAIAGPRAQFLAPIQIDYLVSGYFGWLGSHVVNMADMMMRGADQAQAELRGVRPMEPVRPNADLWNSITGGMIATETTPQSRYVDMLYQQAEAVRKAYASYHEHLARGQTDQARAFYQDNKDLIGKHDLVEKVTQLEAAANRRIKRIGESPTLSAEQKRVEIMKYNAMRNRAAETVFGHQSSVSQ